jgi:hypothetical protein
MSSARVPGFARNIDDQFELCALVGLDSALSGIFTG